MKKTTKDRVSVSLLALFYIISFAGIAWISLARHNIFRDTIENFSDYRTAVILIIFVVLSFVYYIYINNKKQVGNHKIYLFLIAIATICFVTPTFLSADIYAYLLAAKNVFLHQLNPYQKPLAEMTSDPWLKQIGDIWWLKIPTLYGPLATLISAVPLLFTKSLLTSIYLYKFFALLAFSATFYLISSRLPIEQEKRKLIALMFALNPSILIYLVLEGHNDIFVILFFVASYIAYLNKKTSLSFFSLMGSALVKYSTLAILPVFWFRDKKFLIKQAVMSTLIVAISVLLFILVFQIFDSPLYTRELSRMSTGCLYLCNPYHQLVYSLPQNYGIYLNYLIVFLLYLYTSYRYLFKSFNYLKFSFWISFIVIFILTSWNAPWYPTLLITIGILINEKKYHYLVYILTIYSLIHIYLPF